MRTPDTLITTLAVNPDTSRSIFFYLGLIVALAVVLVGVALAVRRRVIGEDYTPESFTLSDLRQMHADGELSDEEFESARRKMIAHHKSMLIDEPASENSSEQPDKEPGGDAPAGG